MLKNDALTLKIRQPKVRYMPHETAFLINQALIEKPKALIYSNN